MAIIDLYTGLDSQFLQTHPYVVYIGLGLCGNFFVEGKSGFL